MDDALHFFAESIDACIGVLPRMDEGFFVEWAGYCWMSGKSRSSEPAGISRRIANWIGATFSIKSFAARKSSCSSRKLEWSRARKVRKSAATVSGAREKLE